jgi:hypothetical protein
VILSAGAFSLRVWSQDSIPSFAEMARQSRERHDAAAIRANTSEANKAQALVDEMQQEEEAQNAAPTGFVSYDAGDYRLFVPHPYTLQSPDSGGAILLGSTLGVTNTVVVAEAPIPIPANLEEIDLQNLARQIAMKHSQSAACDLIQRGLHKAFHCNLTGATLLGRQVWGNLEIVVGSNTLIPVMCVSPDDLRQCLTYDQSGYHTCNSRYPTWNEVQQAKAAQQARFQDENTTAEMCEHIIYPSIQLKEDLVVHPVSIAEKKPADAKPAPATSGTVPQDNSVAYGVQTASLADLARQARHAQPADVQAKLNNARLNNPEGGAAPAGFQFFSLEYCQNPQFCAEASVIIPEKAEVVSKTNGQYIFKAILNGEPVLLYAGPADVNAPYNGMTDSEYARIRDLAKSNGWSREKVDGVSTQELMIDDMPALMTRFRYQRDQKVWWIGERALIQLQVRYVQIRQLAMSPQGQLSPSAFSTLLNGQFLLGCTAPEQRFADAEALCTTLVNSLRLQHSQ